MNPKNPSLREKLMGTFKRNQAVKVASLSLGMLAVCPQLVPTKIFAQAQSVRMSNPMAFRGIIVPETAAYYAEKTDSPEFIIRALPSLKVSDFKNLETLAKLTPIFAAYHQNKEAGLEQAALTLRASALLEGYELTKELQSVQQIRSLSVRRSELSKIATKLQVLTTLRSIYFNEGELKNFSDTYLKACAPLSRAQKEKLSRAQLRIQHLLAQDAKKLTDHIRGGSFNETIVPTAEPSQRKNIPLRSDSKLLALAQKKLYRIAGGSRDSGKVDLAKITTEELTAYFESAEFRNWVASEKQAGREVFLWTDLDMTMGPGDIFTFFYKWRADNGKITEAENQIQKAFLKKIKLTDSKLIEQLQKVDTNDARANAYLILKLWRNKEEGGEGIDLIDLWRDIYWHTQIGLTREEKLAQVKAFAPYYASKIYKGIREENLALQEAGVEVVIVSNGDQELAQAVAPLLGIKRRNVVGATLEYDKKGVSLGLHHSYEIFDKEAINYPQGGKPRFIHYWLHKNKKRFGWKTLDTRKIVSIGATGDSASSDGGMMADIRIPAVLGNFMVHTPTQPGPEKPNSRVGKFYRMMERYAYNLGQFFTLIPDPNAKGAWDDESLDIAP